MNGWMDDFLQTIQEQQNGEIRHLQEEIYRIRGEHVREIAQMRFTFQKELQHQRADEDAKVTEIRKQADRVRDLY